MNTESGRCALFAALVLAGCAAEPATPPASLAEHRGMDQEESIDGAANPEAPPELELFAFLIGSWNCTGRVKDPDGSWHDFGAEWRARSILDGHAIYDEFRETEPATGLLPFGATFRSYDAPNGRWVMWFYNVLAASWLDIAPPELGGVQVGADGMISFKHHLPPDSVLRVTFTDICADSFTWRGEVSADGQTTWEVVLVIETRRVEE